MVPDGWKYNKLSSCLSKKLEYGANESARLYDPENTLRYIRITDIDDKGELIEDRKVGIPLTVGMPYKLCEGDILLARTGATVGKSFIYNESIGACAYAGYLIRVKCDSNQLLARFLYQYLKSPLFWRWVHYTVKVGAQPNISAEQYASMPIPKPPIQEQKTIVNILSTWDHAIEQIQKLIDTKIRLKKGLMQQLLAGKWRFPDFENSEWKRYKLGELFKERKETNRADLPLLSVTSDRGVINRDEVDRKDTSNEDKSKYKRIAQGDIGYNTMRMWQGVSASSSLEGIVSPAYTVITPKSGISEKFAAHLFKYPRVVNLFYRYSQGLVDDTRNLKFHNFAQVPVTIPDRKEQDRIASVLDDLDQSIKQLSNYKDRLITQKKGLMQVLLTGIVRLKTANKEGL